MHEKDLVHRDIKIDNMLVVKKGLRPKISDFSITKQLVPSDQFIYNRSGNSYFMAPENLTQKSFLGKPTDIWSIGVSIYTYITEILPFEAETNYLTEKKASEGKYEIPESFS